ARRASARLFPYATLFRSVLLDAAGLDVGVGPEPRSPAVAAHGGEWAITWTDRRSGRTHLHVNRVTAAGEVLEGTGRALVAPVAGDVSSWALGSGPSGYLLAYRLGTPS